MAEPGSKTTVKHIKTVIRVCVALTAVWLIFTLGDWDAGQLKEAFGRLSIPALFTAVLLFMLAPVCIAIRWDSLLRVQKLDIPLSASIKITFVGLFYNNILLSSVGGDLLRIWYITKHTHRKFEAGLSVLVDRLLGLTTMVIIATSFYWFFPVQGDAENQSADNLSLFGLLLSHRWIILAVVVSSAVAFMVAWRHPATRMKISRLGDFLRARISRLTRAVKLYLSRPGTLVAAVCLTVVAQSLSIIGFWLVGRSLGIGADIKYYFIFFPIAWVIGALPISPGGAGIIEGGLVLLFNRLPGVDPGAVLALAMLYRPVLLLSSLPGLIIQLTGAHLPSVSQMADEQEFFIDSHADS